MGTRRISREATLQFLYQEDLTIGPDDQYGYDLDERFELFCSLFQINRKARPYAMELLQGITGDIGRIDEMISVAATHWRLSRISPTDRNLLRIAVYEMLDKADVPRRACCPDEELTGT